MVQESSLAVTIVARAAYYDRNPTHTSITDITFQVAPHVNTSRGSYTVPALRKAMLSSGNGGVERNTAATTVGAFGSSATAPTQVFKSYSADNTVGAKIFIPVSSGHIMNPGEQATIFDEDLSTAGTCSFSKVLNFVEFDA